jgi:adenosylcobinamide kinase/adenosylcobinamide-phosphate guanylyltransferase
MLTVVLGGARSGKSGYAQTLCGERSVVYIATAEAGEDPEMHARIAKHRLSRPATWTTIEAPLDIVLAASRALPDQAIVLIDCVTVWVSNMMWTHRTKPDDEVERLVTESIDGLSNVGRHRDLIVVSNEVGQGIVPLEPVGRQFRDLQGFANQRLAHAADRVVLLIAGLPLHLKGSLEHGSRESSRG